MCVDNVKYLASERDASAKWSLMILAAVWKVHNDQHQITVSPCVDKYLVHLETPKVRFLMARRSIKEGRDTIYFVGQGIFNVSFSSRQKYRIIAR